MDLTTLNDRRVQWLRDGPDGDVVVSSRVRLARNIDGYPFVSRCSGKQRARIEQLVRNVLSSRDCQLPLRYVRLDRLSPLYRELLHERHLISRRLAEGNWVRAVAFDDDEHLHVMVNDEDHLRLYCTGGGLRLAEAFEQVDQLDDVLAEHIPVAFSERYGYLTSSPLEVGTGMRASVMLHLPGASMAHELEHVVAIAGEANLGVQGVYGEGTHGAGDFYQVFNQVTLGVAEEEIVNTTQGVARNLIELERSCRLDLYSSHPDQFVRRISMAYELLCSAASVSSQEALSLLSQVRLGVEMDLLSGVAVQTVNDLFLLTLPAHLQTMKGAELDSSVRNELRASYLKSRLSTG